MGMDAAIRRPLVLVVEDNPDIRPLYELILSEAGYRVVGAEEGGAGLDLARSLRPSAVVLDMMMPDMDGLEFLDRLPSHGQPIPPVVVVSGFQDFEPHARSRGACAFLRKPAAPEELLATIARALAGRETPEAAPDQVARVAAGREQARREREQLLSRIDLDDRELREMLEGVLAWLSRYHGFGTGLVDLLWSSKIYCEAGAAAGQWVDRDLAFCSDVVDAGSSLVIPDVTVHPVFAGHKAAAYWHSRFYAGSPVVTSTGYVLGTICLIDQVPRRLEAGDMRVFAYLGRRIGDHLAALAERRRPAPFFEPPALFERAVVEVVLDAQLVAAAHVDLMLATLAPGGVPASLQHAARVIEESATTARSAAARWTAETLALVSNGPRPSDTIDHALHHLQEAKIALAGVGVVEHVPGANRAASAGEVITAAEAARARSAATGVGPVRVALSPRDRRP